ncbi:MAG TPA: DUF45 domain-containing protein [Candidatus Merdicola faecigallinarum]|uniref:DUF45 domain-containing protein n=1 Tax=Candidatus Merdicola faecigallinarum TaxID=2840862 RepID=A0A9D1S9L9_9FIRM|nr:DUF45 domain-containing protein [Candidatus Merdicola faecigallinarum]
MNLVKNKSNVITYTVNKAINNRCYISVQNGEVVVKAPWYFSQTEIQNLVEEKRKWIMEKLKEYEILQNAPKTILKILGNEYLVKIEYKSGATPALDLKNGFAIITIPNKYKKNTKEVMQLVINKMYTMLAEKEIERAMEKTRIMLGIAPEDYEIKTMVNTLGKCENGKITIHPEIVTYSREMIDYIILHEFCHLKYKTHSKKFYEMIQKYMPNYEQYGKEINNLKY